MPKRSVNKVYIERIIEGRISYLSEYFPVVLLTGPRQVGKTTLLQKMSSRDRKYVTLDNTADRELAVRDPETFLQRFSPPVFIDEIQYAPELLPYIKIYADTHEGGGHFLLSGSQAFHLMKGVSESLAGRVGIVDMSGLANSELNGARFPAFTTSRTELSARLEKAAPMDIKAVYERIFRGSMPKLCTTDLDHGEFYNSYVRTYIERDIKNLSQVADELAFFRFLGVAAARTGSMLDYAAMANETDVTAPTVKQWMSLLVSSGVVFLIEPYFNNALKRVVKTPRMYFADTGLAAWLTRWGTPETLEAGAMSGMFFETWVVSEIYKSYLNAGQRPPLFYYRDSNTREIDLLIFGDNTVCPVEIKKSANPGTAAVKHFVALRPLKDGRGPLKTEIGPGVVVCLAGTLRPIDADNWAVPAWLI